MDYVNIPLQYLLTLSDIFQSYDLEITFDGKIINFDTICSDLFTCSHMVYSNKQLYLGPSNIFSLHRIC